MPPDQPSDLDEHQPAADPIEQLREALEKEDLCSFRVNPSDNGGILIARLYSKESISGIKFALTIDTMFTMSLQVHTQVVPPTHEFWNGLPVLGGHSGQNQGCSAKIGKDSCLQWELGHTDAAPHPKEICLQ